MQKAKWMDFTPLIDVFLILLFVILINSTVEKTSMAQDQKMEVQSLQAVINQQVSTIESLESKLMPQPESMNPEISDFLAEQVTIVNIDLKTRNNHVWIEDAPTDLYLLYNDQNTPALRAAQKNKIKQVLTTALQANSSGGSLSLFTLSEDGAVFRYAYVLIEEALSELTRELGSDRTFYIELSTD